MKYSKPHVFWCRHHASWVCQVLLIGPRPMKWMYAFGYCPEAAVRYLKANRGITSGNEPRKTLGAKP